MDVKTLLSTPAEESEAPTAIPSGYYMASLTKYTNVKSSKKKTPGIQYDVTLTGVVRLVEDDEEVDEAALVGKILSNSSTTFWFSEKAMFMLTALYGHIGMDVGSRTHAELIPETIGADVIISVVKKPSDRDPSRFYSEVTGFHSPDSANELGVLTPGDDDSTDDLV